MLTAEDIMPGQCYRAKTPRRTPDGYVNDRVVTWVAMNRTQVQYDGPAVKFGRHYPIIPMETFLKWADKDVTETLPEGEWMRWPTYQQKENEIQ